MSTSLARITPEAERTIGEAIAVCAAHVPAVTTVAQFDIATSDLSDVKARLKRLEEQRKRITGPQQAALDAVNALFAKPKQLLKDREAALKQALESYMTRKREAEQAEYRRKKEEADRKAREERERLEAEARKQREAAERARRQAEEAQRKLDEERRAREEAERRAEAERKRAAEAEAARVRGEERRRLLEQQQKEEAARRAATQKAEAERRVKEEARLAEIREREAKARADAAVKQARAETTVAGKVEVRDRFDRSKGVSIRKVWTYTVEDFTALPDIYKKPDTAALEKHAKANGDSVPVPGVRFYQESSVSAKAAQ